MSAVGALDSTSGLTGTVVAPAFSGFATASGKALRSWAMAWSRPVGLGRTSLAPQRLRLPDIRATGTSTPSLAMVWGM